MPRWTSSQTSQSWRLTVSQNSTASDGVEARLGHRLRLEEPLAHDLGAAGAARPQRVHHHVVGVERDEQVGEEREVEDVALLVLGQPGDRRGASRGRRSAPSSRRRR